MGKARRRKKLIQPRSQIRFMAYGLVTVIVALILNLALLFFGLETQLAHGGTVSAGTRAQLRVMLLWQSLCAASVVLPLTTVVGVVMSFHIFGPVYRFQQYIMQLTAGDLSHDLRIRRGDEFVEFEVAIREMVERFRGDFRMCKRTLESILNALEEFKPYVPESHSPRLADLCEQVREALEALPTLSFSPNPRHEEPVPA